MTDDFYLQPPKCLDLTSERSAPRIATRGEVNGLLLRFDSQCRSWAPTTVVYPFEFLDISEKGCGLSGDAPISAGDRILLDIESPKGAEMQVQAECVFSAPSGEERRSFGMRFLNQTAQSKQKIHQIVEAFRYPDASGNENVQ